MRKTSRRLAAALSAAAAALMMASGLALAATIDCPNQTDGLTCVGTPKADTLTGEEVRDRMFGLGANDTVRGLGGDDDLAGMAGNDRTAVGADSDTYMYGEGTWGVDTLVDTQQPVDLTTGDLGNLLYFFPAANNATITVKLTPSTNPEVKKGTNTVNWTNTVVGSVLFDGGTGGDRVTGTAGTNWVGATNGGNTISTGGGNDQVETNSGTGEADIINCGGGTRDVAFFDPGVDQVTGCEFQNPGVTGARSATFGDGEDVTALLPSVEARVAQSQP